MCWDRGMCVGDSLGRSSYLTSLLSENFPAEMISSWHILRKQELAEQGIASPLWMGAVAVGQVCFRELVTLGYLVLKRGGLISCTGSRSQGRWSLHADSRDS